MGRQDGFLRLQETRGLGCPAQTEPAVCWCSNTSTHFSLGIGCRFHPPSIFASEPNCRAVAQVWQGEKKNAWEARRAEAAVRHQHPSET